MDARSLLDRWVSCIVARGPERLDSASPPTLVPLQRAFHRLSTCLCTTLHSVRQLRPARSRLGLVRLRPGRHYDPSPRKRGAPPPLGPPRTPHLQLRLSRLHAWAVHTASFQNHRRLQFHPPWPVLHQSWPPAAERIGRCPL